MKNRFRALFLCSSFVLAPALAADGNVRVFVDRSGTLTVVGDELDNDVFVGRTGMPGQFVVVGRDGTTINGGSSEVLIDAESLRIVLREGEDVAQVEGNIGGSVLLLGGPGNDTLLLGDSEIIGVAVLDGGAGDDVLDVRKTLVQGGFRLVGGDGDDFVLIALATVASQLVIETAPGNDEVSVSRLKLDGSFLLDAGDGADSFRMEDSFVRGDVVLGLGEESDKAALERNQFDARLKIGLGTGNDTLSIGRTVVAQPAAFAGGPGTDTFVDAGSNDFQAGRPTLIGFEIFIGG